MIPLTKIMHAPDDFQALSPFVQDILQRDGETLRANQHEARLWEYAMALESILQWQTVNVIEAGPPTILDAGGASSNLWIGLLNFTSETIRVVDPLCVNEPAGQVRYLPQTLTEYEAAAVENRIAPCDVITCISVIEHIPDANGRPGRKTDLTLFLEAAHRLLRPGGLLVLTTDYWNAEGLDVAHFHWMRERIYNPTTLKALRVRLKEMGFVTFGGADLKWHGPQVYDYAMAAMAFIKKG